MTASPRLTRAALGFCAILTLLVVPGASAEPPRVDVASATARLDALRTKLETGRDVIESRYGYGAIHQTIRTAAGKDYPRLGRSARALATRVYALWATMSQSFNGELERLKTSRGVIADQGHALEDDVAWLEGAGTRIQRELERNHKSLDLLVLAAIRSGVHRAAARDIRAKIRGKRAALARLPSAGRSDPFAALRKDVKFEDLAASAAWATVVALEDALSVGAARSWMPILEPDASRRRIVLRDISVPGSIVRRGERPWPSGAKAGSVLQSALSGALHRLSAAQVAAAGEQANLEAAADAWDAADRGSVSALQLRGLASIRRGARLLVGLNRLPEVSTVVVYANGREIFNVTRPRVGPIEVLRSRILVGSRALIELLEAVLLLRRQLVFHAMAAQRGRSDEAAAAPSGDPVDLRGVIRSVFSSSRAAHVLEGASRKTLEAAYVSGTGALSKPAHLGALVRSFLAGELVAAPADGGSRGPDAAAILAVARLLAKLSDDRVHIPQKFAKKALRKWKFPVPGYPSDRAAAQEVLTDDLTAWVHLPAAIWAQDGLETLEKRLRGDIERLEAILDRHRASDGFAVHGEATLREGMQIDALVALRADFEGALNVSVAGDELEGEGLYMADTPGLLFRTSRLEIQADDGDTHTTLRLALP